MIAVVLAQIATRWGQAVTLLVLATTVTVPAVSVPLYAVAVDRASIGNELASVESSDLVISLPPLRVGSVDLQAGSVELPDDLRAFTGAREELVGFTSVTTVGTRVQGLGEEPPPSGAHRLLARDGFCGHVTFRDGRCPVGSREIALPTALADETGTRPGEEVVLTAVRSTEFGWEPDGQPASLALVGVFDPADPSDPYWALQDPLGTQLFTPAIMTNRTMLRTLPHGQSSVYLDAILPPQLLTPDLIPELRRQLEAAERRLAKQDPNRTTGLATSLPRLLDRIERHGDQARAFLPIAASPLVVLGWFVVYLAVGHSVSGRRREVGAVALRGAKWGTRTMAVAAESLLPVLVGVPAGLAVAQLLVAVGGPGGVGPVAVDGPLLVAAGLAAAGTVVAALLALRRELAAPIVQLLREVPPRRRHIAVATAEVLAVALGVMVVANMRASDGELVGVMVAAPVVVMVAVAVLAARAVRPLIDMAGRGSLHRGRLGRAMAALYLARRPGLAQLVVVLTLVLGTLALAATSTDVAAQARVAEAQRLLGAAHVLDIQRVGRAELLQAVRAADPSGRYAMAVVSAPGSHDDSPVVAVDTTRLAHVALWSDRYGGLEPEEVAALLRPPAAEPMLVSDGEVVAELSPAPNTADETLTVSLLLAPTTGDLVAARFDPVTDDQLTYWTEVTGCADGCRLTGVMVARTDSVRGSLDGVVLQALRQDGQDVMPPNRLADTGWWRSPESRAATVELHAKVAEDGLLLEPRGNQLDQQHVLLALDVPYPLPVVRAGGTAGELLTGIDDQLIRFVVRASLNSLPGIGAAGVLMDLEYAERLTAEPGAATSPQVWLAPNAPAEIVDQLRDHGLVIADDRTIDTVQASIDESGAAIALQFYGLAAGLAVLVGLGALALVIAVDRRTWSRGLRALRAQGLTDRTTTAAAVWSYGGTVLVGAVAGILAGSAAWLAAGQRLPLGVDESLLTDWPQWPQWSQVLAPWALAVVGLLVVAVAGARVVGHGGSQTGTKHEDNVLVTRERQEVGS